MTLSPVSQLYFLICSTQCVQLAIVCYLNITPLGKKKSVFSFFLIDFTIYLYLSMFLLSVHRIKAWDPFEHQHIIYPVYEEVHYTVIIKLWLLEEKAKTILLAGM